MKNKYVWVPWLLAGILLGALVYFITRQVKEHHLRDDPALHVLKQALLPVHPAVKNLRLYKGDKSYTINKEKIFLCLHDENGGLYSMNTLVYVTLHELAHYLNRKDVGHTEAFYQVFDDLLARAQALGVYNPSIPIPENYCKH